jgi:uncharacterized protein (TIGR03083 family)
MNVWTTLVSQGRHRFADTVAALTPEQVGQPTLCAGWDAHLLTAHLLLPFEVSFPRFVVAALRHRGDTDAAVDDVTRRIARRPLADLVRLLHEHADDVVSPRRASPRAQLVETAVHLRDLARPLGLAADVPLNHWRLVLDHLVDPGVEAALVPPGRLDGLRLVATDQDWSHGSGHLVSGPSEALAMALTGRRVAVGDLTGDGVATLTGRMP